MQTFNERILQAQAEKEKALAIAEERGKYIARLETMLIAKSEPQQEQETTAEEQ